jgi:predicted nucleotidyltransferase
MVTQEKGIEQSLEQLSQELGRDPDIDAVYLFGSYASGLDNGVSDIDIGILLATHVPIREYFDRQLQYIARCARILRTDRLDIVLVNDVPFLLAYEVVKHRRILVERNPEQRVTFEVDCINKYLDFKPFLAVQTQYLKHQLLQGTYFD